MGSLLTFTIANTYMYFVEQPISKWSSRTSSLYYRYIDDLFIVSNLHQNTLEDLVRFWNRLDINIKFKESIGQTAEYLDARLENRGGTLVSNVFHKPSHEPFYLPFTSTHIKHIENNIPFEALIRAIRYCSNYRMFRREEVHICMSLLLNNYPINFILEQFERVPRKFQCPSLTQKKIFKYKEIPFR